MEAVERSTPVVITRAEAKAAGLKTYFTGKPCPKGHVAERNVSSWGCVECMRATNAAWYFANLERKRAYDSARYAANPERYRANNAPWRAANAGRMRANNAAWREANPERARAIKASWDAANPEKVSAHGATRRARKLAAIPADWCPADQAVVRKMYAACKRLEALTGFKWQVDHRVPLSKGGAHCAANLQVIPARLNLRKHAKSLYQEPFAWVADALADPALQLPWMAKVNPE